MNKFIVKVLVKTQETCFSPLLLLDFLLIQVLKIVIVQVLLVLLLKVMITQNERGSMMIVILKMMVRVLHIHNKINIH